ncbi:MAG: NosD domain-containing protein [Candidatus Heimdallarchaeaceae archaeon]
MFFILFIIISTVIAIVIPISLKGNKNILEITSDEDMILNQFSGSGTQLDPYVIENKELGIFKKEIESYQNLLYITNITKHVLIKNNKFIGGHRAILIENLRNASITIKDNYFEAKEHCFNNLCISSFYAIGIVNSSNILIQNNRFKESNYFGYLYGTYLEDSENIQIFNNNISAFYSIYVIDSAFFNVKNNHFFESVDAYIEQSSYFTIQNNIHDYLFRFIITYSSFGNILENRIIGYNNSFGFLIDNSRNMFINANEFFQNTVGIRIFSSTYFFITENSFESNLYYAIELYEDTSEISAFRNNFQNNNINSTKQIQAFDSGNFNRWYDTVNLIGNYWSNLGTNATYSIDGSADSQDNYPLTNPI